jgi:hypothetical protein
MAIANVAALLRDARDIAVLTGAGISAESGIPTFREALTGLWSSYDPQVLATPQGFRRQPRLVWDWYAERRARVLEAAPNPGHFALAELERRAPRAQDASPLLGRISSSTNGVIFVLLPDTGGRSATTSPRFMRTETVAD